MPPHSPLDQQAIKRQNRRLLLESIRRRGPSSRADLARELGLTKSTVSSLTQELIGEGLLSEGSPQASASGTGRPGILLELRPQGALALGVELGVKNTVVIVLDLGSQTQQLLEWPEASDTPLAQRLERIARQIQQHVPGREHLLGLGLTVPGVVRDDQTLVYAPGPGWRNAAPAEQLEALLGLRVVVQNDANASALGEAFWGESHSPLAYVMLGTGLGIGLVVDGQVYRGHFGAAGELGHWKEGSDRPCSCGRWGCLETELSLRALEQHFQALSRRTEDFWGILGLAGQGYGPALESLEALGGQLGRLVANLAVTFDPAVVVLGGAGAEAWQWLEAPTRRRLSELAFIPEHACLPIRPSAFGHLAPAMGAAALVLQRFLANGGVREGNPPISPRALG
ncbi:N-acetylglucosamine repressor [Calidithermus terrae]|uniref:N-acetylglucosamine repressor n=1 Tax=Calidithermus terrae TaxID=1408545 RepID=A0A399F647_9DEIN|nr:ROK family transcriptional regulator [Calidithermus terrae]RIH90352.1 N-acetylglucosamine repressor [Calidithermus terrae]